MIEIRTCLRRCLILPSLFYWLAWGSAALTIALSWWASRTGDLHKGQCGSTRAHEFLAAKAKPMEICALGVAAQPTEHAETRRCDGSACKCQCLFRQERIGEAKREIHTACSRRGYHLERVVVEPLARRVVAEEDIELRRLYGRLRQLQGPKPAEETRENISLLAITCALGLAALYGFGRHARSVGIRRCHQVADIRVPFLTSAGVTLIVATPVILVESLDNAKSGFDWSSFCIDQNAFWIHHATVLPLTLLVATQLAAGFYATRDTHLPVLNPARPAWGVRRYVTFLETWCFLLVILVGAVAAIWLHKLAAEPTRTNVILSFLGWGALACTAALAVRIVRTAMTLRDKCEALALTVARAPDSPTSHLLGAGWWQAPAVFAVAANIAWWLLDYAGALKLYTLP